MPKEKQGGNQSRRERLFMGTQTDPTTKISYPKRENPSRDGGGESPPQDKSSTDKK